jgi:GlpG protein
LKRIVEVPLSLDLQAFSQWLRAQNVEHRISVEGDHQVFWLADERLEQSVMAALEQYMNDPELRSRLQAAPQRSFAPRGHWQASPGQAPLTLAMIVIAALLAWFTGFGVSGPMAELVIVNPNEWNVGTMGQRWDSLLGTLAQGQFWRLFTPDFLHFSVSHLIFNAVMLWFLGSQIEVRDGQGRLVLLAVVTSLTANVAQYLLTGPLFGGLSGVVYGVIAYTWLSQRDYPRFIFPPALMAFSLVWLLIGLTPLPQQLGIGSMANGAHLGGLLGGLAVAALLPVPRTRTEH